MFDCILLHLNENVKWFYTNIFHLIEVYFLTYWQNINIIYIKEVFLLGFEIINELKKEKGLTNLQLAKLSGTTLSTIDKITAGINQNPKLDTLKAICKVLGCSLNDFEDSPTVTTFSELEKTHIKKIPHS